jgi:hypothetical protein
MDAIAMAITSAALLAVVWFVLKKYPVGARRKWRDPFAGFDEVVRRVEQANGEYFRSLELMLKNLETLRLRTEQAEQRLWGIVARPGIERQDRYEAAELLLVQGQKPAKVASMLNLPLSQIKSMLGPRGLSGRQETPKAKKAGAAPASLDRNERIDSISAPRAKRTARSTPYDPAAAADGVEFFAGENRRPRVNGTAE